MSTTSSTTSAATSAATSTVAATGGIAVRSLRNIRRLPAAFIPALAMPVFQMFSFSGTYRGVTEVPGFPTDRSINWFLPLAVVMGSMFAGVGIGFSTIRDLESGFYDRLRMSPAPRHSLLLGPLMSAWARAMLAIVLVVALGVAFGARVTGGVLGLVTLTLAGLGMATIGTGWGLGLAYRFRDMRAAAIMQLTLFVGLFLSEAQTPLAVIDGWLHTVATYNPFTYVLRLSRTGFLGEVSWGDTWGGLVAIAALGSLAMLFARTGLATLDD